MHVFSLALMAGPSPRPLEHETILVSFPEPPHVYTQLKKSGRGKERKEGLVSSFTRPSFPMGHVRRGSRDETKTIQWPDTPLVGIQAGSPLTPQVVGILFPIHESCHEDYFGRDCK